MLKMGWQRCAPPLR
ncbi:hypothetical protein [Synechococcus sp. MIT S1220]